MKILKLLCNQTKDNIFKEIKFNKSSQNISIISILNVNIPKYKIPFQGSFFSKDNYNNKSQNFLNITKFNFSKRTHEKSTFNDLTTKHKSEVKFSKSTTTGKEESISKSATEGQTPGSTKVTSKLLCELIGCKHYLTNEEINIEEDVLVNVYDESDKFLGKQTFGETLNHAHEIGKDVILRNDKVIPPVVKIMKYKVELVKRLMKKLGKTVESEKKENLKYMTLSQNISENDFYSKQTKIKELLAHFSYIRVVVPCDINNTEEVLKSTSLLNTLSNDLSEFCKIKAGPIRQKQKKQKIEAFDTKITDSIHKINKQEKEIQQAFELAQITDINNDKDLDYINSVYIDYESLLLDSTGINYEKLLDNVNLEGLIKGITKTNVINKAEVESKSKEDQATVEQTPRKQFYESLAKGIQGTNFMFEGEKDINEQIEFLEKEALDQKDLKKKSEISQRVDKMKTELETKKIRIANKSLKKTILDIVKETAIKQGVYNTEEAK